MFETSFLVGERVGNDFSGIHRQPPLGLSTTTIITTTVSNDVDIGGGGDGNDKFQAQYHTSTWLQYTQALERDMSSLHSLLIV